MALEYSNKRCPPNEIDALTFRTTADSGKESAVRRVREGKWKAYEGGLSNVYLEDSETL